MTCARRTAPNCGSYTSVFAPAGVRLVDQGPGRPSWVFAFGRCPKLATAAMTSKSTCHPRPPLRTETRGQQQQDFKKREHQMAAPNEA